MLLMCLSNLGITVQATGRVMFKEAVLLLGCLGLILLDIVLAVACPCLFRPNAHKQTDDKPLLPCHDQKGISADLEQELIVNPE